MIMIIRLQTMTLLVALFTSFSLQAMPEATLTLESTDTVTVKECADFFDYFIKQGYFTRNCLYRYVTLASESFPERSIFSISREALSDTHGELLTRPLFQLKTLAEMYRVAAAECYEEVATQAQITQEQRKYLQILELLALSPKDITNHLFRKITQEKRRVALPDHAELSKESYIPLHTFLLENLPNFYQEKSLQTTQLTELFAQEAATNNIDFFVFVLQIIRYKPQFITDFFELIRPIFQANQNKELINTIAHTLIMMFFCYAHATNVTIDEPWIIDTRYALLQEFFAPLRDDTSELPSLQIFFESGNASALCQRIQIDLANSEEP